MESNELLSLIGTLDENIDDMEEVLFPFLRHALSDTARNFPLLDQAQLFVLITYAIESSLFSYLRLNGINAKEHPVFRELARVKQYFEKIKSASEDRRLYTAKLASATTEGMMKSFAEGRRLFVGNLAFATTEGDLREFFAGYSIETISIPVNPRTARPTGYAFIDLSIAEEAHRALTELSGKEILGRKVSTQLAKKLETAQTSSKTRENSSVDKAAAVRFIKNALAGNDDNRRNQVLHQKKKDAETQ